jgi:predicted outer membrane repeat protein
MAIQQRILDVLGSNRRSRNMRMVFAVITGLAMFGVVIGSQVADASTQTVSNCADSGTGSLRAAVSAASSGDTIDFALSPACSLITLTSGDIEIATNLAIDGPGANDLAVSGNNASQVFVVESGVTATISALTIENGSVAIGGGGINNTGTLTVTDSIISDSSATHDGGGIYSDGTLTITNSSVSDNSTTGSAIVTGGGNTGGGGGGIYNDSGGSLTITNSSVSNNDASGSITSAGGISNLGNLTISNSTLSGNTATSDSGAIDNGPGGNLTISNSTVSGNTAGGNGGAITNNTTTTISDSTVSGNHASGSGGALFTVGGVVTISNSTLSGNSHGPGWVGAGIQSNGGTVSFQATILANNSGGNCSNWSGVPLVDNGYNLDDDGSCGFSGTSLSDTPAGLDPSGLQKNGGPTQTIALEPGSAAIDHVTDSADCPATDQRGVLRSVPCDIGAYETPTSTTTSTSLSGGGETGTTISVPAETNVTDTATLTGTNASTATGTVTYDVYSDNECSTAVSTGTAETIMTPGTLPPSSPVSLPVGTYYWQATYSGDYANQLSTSTCGSEVETVTSPVSIQPTTLTTSLLGASPFGGSWLWWHGDVITVFSGTPVTDSATLTGANASTASGTVTYTVYSDPWQKHVVASGGTVTVSGGVVPNSTSLTLPRGIYFWQASYSGDPLNGASTSKMGSEIELVVSPPRCSFQGLKNGNCGHFGGLGFGNGR